MLLNMIIIVTLHNFKADHVHNTSPTMSIFDCCEYCCTCCKCVCWHAINLWSMNTTIVIHMQYTHLH